MTKAKQNKIAIKKKIKKLFKSNQKKLLIKVKINLKFSMADFLDKINLNGEQVNFNARATKKINNFPQKFSNQKQFSVFFHRKNHSIK